MINSLSPYSASFTAGSLLFKETSCLLPLLLSEQRKKLVREEIKYNNLLKINSESSRERVVREITKRMTHVNDDFWRFYADYDEREQKLLLFYMCLKTYKLMFDFHFNVTVKRWNSSSRRIDPYFYQLELNELAAKDELVDGWSDQTKSQLISVYLRTLKETGLLVAVSQTVLAEVKGRKCNAKDVTENTLQPVIVPDDFWRYFVRHNETWFLDACLLSPLQKQFVIPAKAGTP